jgi:ribosomal protein S27AE
MGYWGRCCKNPRQYVKFDYNHNARIRSHDSRGWTTFENWIYWVLYTNSEESQEQVESYSVSDLISITSTINKCPNCGEIVENGSKFCGHCGYII